MAPLLVFSKLYEIMSGTIPDDTVNRPGIYIWGKYLGMYYGTTENSNRLFIMAPLLVFSKLYEIMSGTIP
ncbi:hypothetical protein J6590_057517 [Homalodisca vitripennis]|nr:hypothetical protein J6590_057517 [Homalodisca vitripennis]